MIDTITKNPLFPVTRRVFFKGSALPAAPPGRHGGTVLRPTPLLPKHEAPVLTGRSPPHNSPRLFPLRGPSHRPPWSSQLSRSPAPRQRRRFSQPFHPATPQRINGRAGIPPACSPFSRKLAGQAPPSVRLSTKGLGRPGEAPPPYFHKTRPGAEPLAVNHFPRRR